MEVEVEEQETTWEEGVDSEQVRGRSDGSSGGGEGGCSVYPT